MEKYQQNIINNAQKWLAPHFDNETQAEVQQLLKGDFAILEDQFYKNLEFGTGGMRGIMGVGTNRLNKYTLGQATQGLANYLKSIYGASPIKVAVAYDVRNNSQSFAKIVADVLTANGIRVLLFQDARPTPELSFSVRTENCQAGIVLTASHNPPEYNGYKVYWNNGAQVVPPHDKAIINEVLAVQYEQILFDGNDELLEYFNEKQDDIYIQACIKNSLYAEGTDTYKNLQIVFSSLHGTTHAIIPKALETAGFEHIHLVDKQMIPDGNFPTVKSPNPEEPAAFEMAIALADEHNADIAIATDPDGDRLGIAIRSIEGEMQLLNGNQCNTILTHYILTQWQKKGKLHPKNYIASTIVSSDIFFDIAQQFGITCYATLTGFKWIGKLIQEKEQKEKFICGGEESFGFMTGDFVRDKDSCGSILLACEIAAWCKSRGVTMFDYLLEIYTETGTYQEKLVNLVRRGKQGAEEIKQMMQQFRENPPTELDGNSIIKIEDYQLQIARNLSENSVMEMAHLPKSDVLIFYTEGGNKICIRPSGTEPKIKFYISVKDNFKGKENYATQIDKLNKKIENIQSGLNILA